MQHHGQLHSKCLQSRETFSFKFQSIVDTFDLQGHIGRSSNASLKVAESMALQPASCVAHLATAEVVAAWVQGCLQGSLGQACLPLHLACLLQQLLGPCLREQKIYAGQSL